MEKEQLQAQQATFASRLETNPEDSEALEGAAVTDINLGDYEKGESLLAQLVAVKSDDPDAWRLLAESRTALGRTAAAVEAYKGAFAASPDDVVLLKGLAGSLVADGRQSVAVDEIKAVRARLTAAPSQGSSTGADAAAGDDVPRLTAIELDLLLAKVYAQWKGHVGDAFEVYDNVIVDNPEDFRCGKLRCNEFARCVSLHEVRLPVGSSCLAHGGGRGDCLHCSSREMLCWAAIVAVLLCGGVS